MVPRYVSKKMTAATLWTGCAIGLAPVAGLAPVFTLASIVVPTVAFASSMVQPGDAPAEKAPDKESAKAGDATGKVGEAKPSGSEADVSEPKPNVYLLTLDGEFGRRVAPQSLAEALLDVKKTQADYLIIKFDLDWAFGGKQIDATNVKAEQESRFITWNQGMSVASEMGTMLTEKIRDDKTWTRKPKVIGWVKNAMGPGALLVLGFKELYYDPQARHGGMGYLETLFEGSDETARQKQISLREGAARGLGNKGCFDEMIVLAMTKTSYVLSVTYEGGKPKLFPNDSGEELLTDDGVEGNKDTLEDIVRGKGNDVLTLNADLASKLKISKGTAGTLDELLEEIGIVRNYKKIDGKSNAIFNAWERRVNQAEEDLRDLMNQYGQVRVENDTVDGRISARGKQIGLLKKADDILERYEKALNPRSVARALGTGSIDQARNIIRNRIEQLKQANMFERR